uniref:Uncharacterized protein n=1 Tax=Parastrongyloides trichosuri TaxID=131310 RepID=A0A0N4ZGH7_PARTI
MGIRDNFVNMLGDFVQMNKCPELRSKGDLTDYENTKSESFRSRSNTNENYLSVDNNPYRRHSIQIHVGTGGPPEAVVRHRTYSVNVSSTNESDKDLKAAAKAAKENKKRFSTGHIEAMKSKSLRDLNKSTYRLFNKPRPKSLGLSEDEDEVFERSGTETVTIIKEEDDDQTPVCDTIKIDTKTNIVIITTH